MFNQQEIADYYNQTMNHYNRWWKLSEVQSLHYGIWEKDTKTFKDALHNTNITFASIAGIQSQHSVLDAGCGVGGAAFFLAKNIGCKVTGITLSHKQLQLANQLCKQSGLEHLVNFEIQNFSKTNFADASFDVVWACESVCYAHPKSDFIDEMYRVLKPGGRLIIADYFLTDAGKTDEKKYMKKWGDTWAITQFSSKENLVDQLAIKGFLIEKNKDITSKIFPSAKKMFAFGLLGAIPSILYNITHDTTRFAKTHYLSGIYQYKALKDQLWTYNIVLAVKN